MRKPSVPDRNGERGVTIVLVAISMVALLALAALAIDIATLYAARGETQRAADAAALAGAKMFVTSGFTSVQGGGSPPVSQVDVCVSGGPGSTAAANAQAEAAASRNQIVGQPAALQSVACDFSQPGNPQITVAVQRTGLPTFFARIWGGTSNTVTAAATAEAYNPSGLSTPLQIDGVKPWLVPNCDPNSTTPADCLGHTYFVNPVDGSIANNGLFIGKTLTFTRHTDTSNPNVGDFYPLNVPIDPPTAVCPSTSAVSCSQVGTDAYRDNIACTSKRPFVCGQPIGFGEPVTVNISGSIIGKTVEGGNCLIHADNEGLNQGQDVFSTPSAPSTPPVLITGGDNNPNPALRGVANISRSDSIVTVPLYDGRNMCPSSCNQTTNIVGFLQLGIKRAMTLPPAQFEAVILNATGCNPGASGSPVSGGGVSPIPVRLIHQ